MGIGTFLLILLSQTGEMISQVFFKKGANNIDTRGLRGAGAPLKFFAKVITAPFIWYGFIAVGGAIAAWMLVLSKVTLSFAFPFQSLQALMIMAASVIVLKERMNAQRIVGTVLIVVGIIIVAATK